MRIIPVIDLKEGVVVRGVAGRRQEYRPIESRLVASCQPLDVGRMFRERFDLRELYVADLDAIGGAEPAWATCTQLRQLGSRLWVDAGVRHLADAFRLVERGIEKIVVGLETVAGPEELAAICRECGPERVAFSLDLKQGAPMGDGTAWEHADAAAIAERALIAGVCSLIVLDLTRVGVNDGTGTEELCQRIARFHPEVELVAGGGVRHRADLQRLRDHGVKAALVASALHDERITREDLDLLPDTAE